jgi:hypothetical protein
VPFNYRGRLPAVHEGELEKHAREVVIIEHEGDEEGARAHVVSLF